MDDETLAFLEGVVAPPERSIADAIAQLDLAGTGGLVLSGPDRHVDGLLTDGDIRRAVLRKVSLADPCGSIATHDPVVARAPIAPAEALQVMLQQDVNHLPVVDGAGVLVDFLLRKNIVADVPGDLSAVVMAGGFGKRLLPLTENVPKPMLLLGERPLLERTIEQLRGAGIREVHLTTHYLPDQIARPLRRRRGLRGPDQLRQRGRAPRDGRRAAAIPRPDGPLLVMNGDILTRVVYQDMLRFHRKHGAQMTVGLRAYEVQVPFGVVECDDVRVTDLAEKPQIRLLVNAGIYLLEPSAWDLIPGTGRFDMTDLIRRLLDERQTVVGFPVIEYWQDVGRHEDYRQAQEDVRTVRI